MTNDVMAVDERLAKLEVTVANGFHELGARMSGLEGMIGGLEGRLGGLEGRLGGLEGGLGGLEGRMARLEDRMDAFNEKLDVVAECLDGKMQLVLERLDAHIREMRVTAVAMQREHRADRRLMYGMLKDHRVRIEALEHAAHHPAANPAQS